jgi:hypothetical protein
LVVDFVKRKKIIIKKDGKQEGSHLETRRQPWKKQLTGDNPVKNRQTRRQPWKKQLMGDNLVKKQTDKETTL